MLQVELKLGNQGWLWCNPSRQWQVEMGQARDGDASRSTDEFEMLRCYRTSHQCSRSRTKYPRFSSRKKKLALTMFGSSALHRTSMCALHNCYVWCRQLNVTEILSGPSYAHTSCVLFMNGTEAESSVKFLFNLGWHHQASGPIRMLWFLCLLFCFVSLKIIELLVAFLSSHWGVESSLVELFPMSCISHPV